MDETADATGRLLGHFVVGKLDTEDTFLDILQRGRKTSGETIAYFVNSSLKGLYPSGAHDDRVLLLYSDAAAYMHKATDFSKFFIQNYGAPLVLPTGFIGLVNSCESPSVPSTG